MNERREGGRRDKEREGRGEREREIEILLGKVKSEQEAGLLVL